MKLWKVLAKSSYIYSTNSTDNTVKANGTELHEFKCRSPTWSNSAESVLSDPSAPGRPAYITTVEIRKTRGETLGIVFQPQGSDVGYPTISSLRPGSAAERSDQLAPGDSVRSVNGISTASMQPDEMSSLLDNIIGDVATLELEYNLPEYKSRGSLCVQSKITTVTLECVDGSLGITLRGGAPPSPGDQPAPSPTPDATEKLLVVAHVRPGGPAHRSGRIKVGDRLLKVDHHSLANKTLLDAHQLLRLSTSAAGEAPGGLGLALTSLTVEYDVRVMGGMRYAAGPLLVEVERRPREPLGLVLGPQRTGVGVQDIVPASTADRCGAFHVGDQILAVDETYIEGSSATSEEVTWLLQNYNTNQGCTRLQIMPYQAIGNDDQNRERIRRGRCPPGSSMSSRGRLNQRYTSSQQSSGACYPQRRHVETLTVALTAAPGVGYGLTVHEVGDAARGAIVVATVVPDSPAYRCGCLQVSDRLISLNGRCSLTLQEVSALLELGITTPGSRLVFQTEFDVTDAVVSASGTSTVKIAKNGPDLGITITASRSIPNEPFIISDIRRGSAAHRTGTLQVGDQVLAIDDQSLDQANLDEAFDTVKNSQEEIITLRIQKVDASPRSSEVSEPLEEIIYTVELNRRGEPLGITVSGSEDQTEPIILSALTQGGLAEKTGALHVGDRILAINSENLEQRPLSDAIRLLQTSADKIQIMIARQIKNNSDGAHLFQDLHDNNSSPELASIDSAIESWDSGVMETPNNNVQVIQPIIQPPHIFSTSAHSKHIEPTVILSSFSFSNDYQYQPELPVNERCPQDELVTFGNKKHHESQILFYSDVENSVCSSPSALSSYNLTNMLPSFDSSYSKPSLSTRNGYKYSKYEETYSESATTNVEMHQVTLHKDSVYDDYGFSVSDGLYEKGVYINRIRRGGPAHLAGVLRPYDRILQVNDTKTKNFDCILTVPLIASAGEKIELVIARNPYIRCPNKQNVLSWKSDEQILQKISTKSVSAIQNTIIKTL